MLNAADPSLEVYDDYRAASVCRDLLRSLAPPIVFVAWLANWGRENRKIIRGLLGLARHQIPFEVLLGPPDSFGQDCYEIIERAALSRLSAQVSASLLALAPSLDDRIAWFVTDLFRRPERYTTTDAVMRELDISLTIQRVDRLLSVAGLASFEKLRRSARVARARQMFVGCGWTVTKAVQRLGYGSDDALAADIKKVTGLTPSQLATDAVEGERSLSEVADDGLVGPTSARVTGIANDALLEKAIAYCLMREQHQRRQVSAKKAPRMDDPGHCAA